MCMLLSTRSHTMCDASESEGCFRPVGLRSGRDVSAGACWPPMPASRPLAHPPSVPPPPFVGMVLLLAKLCSHMEGQTVLAAMEALAGAFPPRGGSSRRSDEPPAFVAGEVARRLGTAASASLDNRLNCSQPLLASLPCPVCAKLSPTHVHRTFAACAGPPCLAF